MNTTAKGRTEELRRVVERVIEENQPGDYQLILRDFGRYEIIDSWVGHVDVDREDVDGMDFARRLVDLEELVEKELHESIQLQPAMHNES